MPTRFAARDQSKVHRSEKAHMITSAVARPADFGRVNSRCDSCSAPARVLILLTGGNDLVFCEHHARQYKAALTPIAVLVEHLPGAD